ncbi:hypothetical protein SY89_03018 [Halolamina pelagica]|uniref:Uncharacterized protein n=1 Tax=Halolamina pelagica TaxID=699431 RepID=A0A0P7HYE4_9EURY|nr:hypothetical protein [Halolamina pelagica]KPN32250.1 hypothetical protein SY89_03018 [Halolamina pelagica]
MERRTFLTGAAGALTMIAGCVGSNPETPDDGPAASETPTATPASPTITARSLEPRQDCEEPGSATIAAAGATVTVDGCIVGKNGCMVASLVSATYDADADELAVRVATRDESDEDEACTQQLVNRGYTVTVEFDGGLPGTTTVTHDGVDGEQQVAQSETGG